jgi:hypothetical protein
MFSHQDCREEFVLEGCSHHIPQSPSDPEGTAINAVAFTRHELGSSSALEGIPPEFELAVNRIIVPIDQRGRLLKLQAISHSQRITVAELAEILLQPEGVTLALLRSQHRGTNALPFENALFDGQSTQVSRTLALVLFFAVEESNQSFFK